ncbi:MAG: formate--tetrahydrofolate ligase, partial [Nitrospirota bacterium]
MAAAAPAETGNAKIPLNPPFSKGEIRFPPLEKGGKGGFEIRDSRMKPIPEIAASIGLISEDIEQSGQYIAKVTPTGLNKRFSQRRGKYVVITAITPTGSGEGKTTVAIGLGMAMRHLGRKGIVTLRQPSLGPLFGMKGGGTGGGMAMLLPQETINLGLTGDNY